jgi:predicted ArsR family transcriptional regulator
VRLRILRLLRFDELTNAEIAAQLELNPATTLHHVRTLLRSEFIEAGRSRPGPNGITEKPYRGTPKSWTLEIADSPARARAGTAAIEAFTHEVAEPGAKVEALTRLTLRLDPAGLDELRERLTAIFDEYEARADPGGAPLALFLAIHRRPKRRRPAASD